MCSETWFNYYACGGQKQVWSITLPMMRTTLENEEKVKQDLTLDIQGWWEKKVDKLLCFKMLQNWWEAKVVYGQTKHKTRELENEIA